MLIYLIWLLMSYLEKGSLQYGEFFIIQFMSLRTGDAVNCTDHFLKSLKANLWYYIVNKKKISFEPVASGLLCSVQ